MLQPDDLRSLCAGIVDADELARIAGGTLRAIREATAYAEAKGIDDEFREILRHCRDMHELLLEALIELEPDLDNEVRGFADRARASILRLVAMLGPDSLVH